MTVIALDRKVYGDQATSMDSLRLRPFYSMRVCCHSIADEALIAARDGCKAYDTTHSLDESHFRSLASLRLQKKSLRQSTATDAPFGCIGTLAGCWTAPPWLMRSVVRHPAVLRSLSILRPLWP